MAYRIVEMRGPNIGIELIETQIADVALTYVHAARGVAMEVAILANNAEISETELKTHVERETERLMSRF